MNTQKQVARQTHRIPDLWVGHQSEDPFFCQPLVMLRWLPPTPQRLVVGAPCWASRPRGSSGCTRRRLCICRFPLEWGGRDGISEMGLSVFHGMLAYRMGATKDKGGMREPPFPTSPPTPHPPPPKETNPWAPTRSANVTWPPSGLHCSGPRLGRSVRQHASGARTRRCLHTYYMYIWHACTMINP